VNHAVLRLRFASRHEEHENMKIPSPSSPTSGWIHLATSLALILTVSGCANLQLGDLARIFSASGALDEATVSDGLRQALSVGTDRASSELSAPGGFGANQALRLVLPSELDSMVSTVRTVGLGAWVDDIEDGMNRAAEAAAEEAKPVFVDAIKAMTIQDAFEILRGPDDAATAYFRQKTSATLQARFAPVVTTAMKKVGVYAKYQDLLGRYTSLPFAKPMPPSLEDYVTTKTLDGLFTVLAREEAKIRDDPAARTTALLRQVFGADK
jgi:hypothetical protein